MSDYSIDQQAIEEALIAPPLKVPDETGIKTGQMYFTHVKIGGEMQLVSVRIMREPYVRKLGNCTKATYVDVFGYGVKKSINIKKLRIIPREV